MKMKKLDAEISLPAGFLSAGLNCGLKKSGKEDIAIIYSTKRAAAAAVFTQNRVAAAPVLVSREVAAKGYAQAIVCNSRYANACTGEQGLADAREMAHITGKELGIGADEVFVCSTGIIGAFLPMDSVKKGIETAAERLSADSFEAVMKAIMTTDTFTKHSSYELEIGGQVCKITGIAKGSGMIHPNMATMLGFIVTDAGMEPDMLDKALRSAVDSTFNMITVDGDSSTNDSVIILANGIAGNKVIDRCDSEDYMEFTGTLEKVCRDLAKLIVLDGEGATKFLEITVTGAESVSDAKAAAVAVAKSPLVKTAFFGCDANCVGRILCAVGYSGACMQQDKVTMELGGIKVVEGDMSWNVDDDILEPIMKAKEIKVSVDLHMGIHAATVWTCDLSYDYVRINGDYRT